MIARLSCHFPLTFVSCPRGCDHFLSLPYLSPVGVWEGETVVSEAPLPRERSDVSPLSQEQPGGGSRVGCKHTFHPSAETDIYTYLPGALCQALCWELVTDSKQSMAHSHSHFLERVSLLPRQHSSAVPAQTECGRHCASSCPNSPLDFYTKHSNSDLLSAQEGAASLSHCCWVQGPPSLETVTCPGFLSAEGQEGHGMRDEARQLRPTIGQAVC